VKIGNYDIIPADILIVSASTPEGAIPSGICYVETKSLDGETNLKLRQVLCLCVCVCVFDFGLCGCDPNTCFVLGKKRAVSRRCVFRLWLI
jgi:magnesium-transporting ATPase (P-type)